MTPEPKTLTAENNLWFHNGLSGVLQHKGRKPTNEEWSIAHRVFHSGDKTLIKLKKIEGYEQVSNF